MPLSPWLRVKEAADLAKVVDMTVRRWITKHKDDPKCVEYKKGIYYVNTEEFNKDYKIIPNYDNKVNNEYTDVNTEKLALMSLSKQSNDVAYLLLNKPIYRHSTFWTAVVSICIIIIVFGFGYLYRNELISSYTKEISSINNGLTEAKQVIATQRDENKELKEQYQAMLNEVKSSYQKLTSEQERQIAELNKKLKDIEAAAKSQPPEIVSNILEKPISTGQGTDTEKIPISLSK